MDETMLQMLKVDLRISTTAYDTRLGQLLTAAQAAIMAEGAELTVSAPLDAELVVMYAAWLWRKRETMDEMPRMLRVALNNRVFGGKMRHDT